MTETEIREEVKMMPEITEVGLWCKKSRNNICRTTTFSCHSGENKGIKFLDTITYISRYWK